MTSSPVISAIVAMSENRVIGKDNQLPWHLPADLKHFKTLTLNHPIIMGRKTYESIGKPLPQRTNIVVTRDKQLQLPGCLVVHSLMEAIEQAVTLDNQAVFIIGGAEIFKEALAIVQRIYLTIVHADFAGDVYFPVLEEGWQVVESKRHEADEVNNVAYSFLRLEKQAGNKGTH